MHDRGPTDVSYHAAEAAGTRFSFVQLRPSRAVLEQRVTGPSRIGTQKVRDLDALRLLLDRHDLVTPINQADLSIDNSELSPGDVATAIGDHVRLQPVAG